MLARTDHLSDGLHVEVRAQTRQDVLAVRAGAREDVSGPGRESTENESNVHGESECSARALPLVQSGLALIHCTSPVLLT